MANIDNLISPEELNARLTPEKRHNNAVKAGVESGKKRAKNKTWADILERLGNLPVKSKKNREIMLDAGLTDEDMISDVQKMFRLNMKADAGDLKAVETIARIRGELKNININENYNTEVAPEVLDISGGADDDSSNDGD